jgi:hypothetical protein
MIDSRIIEKRVAIIVLSISSLIIFNILSTLGIIYGVTETGLVLISLIFFVFSTYTLINDFKFGSKYFKSIFSLFLLYEVIIIARGWTFLYEDIKLYLQSGFIFWPFLIPIFVFFDKSLIILGFLMKWIFYICLVYLVIIIFQPNLLLDRRTVESLGTLVATSGFLWLNANYLSNRKTNIVFIVLAVTLLSLTYLARRNGMVTFLGLILAGYFLNILNKTKILIFRIFPLILFFAVIFFFTLSNFAGLLTKQLDERLKEDTRTELFEGFLFDMRDDWVFGKGLNGTYYYPMPETEITENMIFPETVNRNIIENGYLQLFLTGGIVHVILFLLILIPAAINGILRSSNQLAKACGVIIFLRLIDMFIAGLPSLSVTYIITWISIGICYNQGMLNRSESEIQIEFQKIDL